MELRGFFVFSCVEAKLARYIIEKKHAKVRIIDEIRKFHGTKIQWTYTLVYNITFFWDKNDVFLIFSLTLPLEMMNNERSKWTDVR